MKRWKGECGGIKGEVVKPYTLKGVDDVAIKMTLADDLGL